MCTIWSSKADVAQQSKRIVLNAKKKIVVMAAPSISSLVSFFGYECETLTNFLSAAVDFTATPDSESFLFTLVNPSGSNPVKIIPKQGAGGGIRCRQSCGPSFGTSIYYDLQIWDGSPSSDLELGYGFTCPLNTNKETYFTGKGRLEIDELEVYEVNV